MSEGANATPQVEGFIRYKKVKGTHRMLCPIRKKQVVLGVNREDGNVAYLTPAGIPPGSNESWERIDSNEYVAEAAEQEMQEKAGKPEGTLEVVELATLEGFYNVINTATDKPINTEPLTKEEAEIMVSGSPKEKKGLLARLKDKMLGKDKEQVDSGNLDKDVCPNGHNFGKDYDEHEDCDNCDASEYCQAEREVTE